MKSVQNQIKRSQMIEAGKRYAAYDRSDPFTFNRVMTHINNGIASPFGAKDEGGFYDAEEYQETRTLPSVNGKPGEEYQATVHRNVKRV